MRKLADIDILSDDGLRRRIVAVSLAPLAAGASACVLAFVAGVAEPFGLGWVAAFCVASAAALPVHELVHAAAFKLLVPGVCVTFGFKDAFLYTSANGAVARRGAEIAVLLAPTVLVTSALACVACACGAPALAVGLAAMHLSGCAGDVLMVAEICREPECTHVRDAEFGIVLLQDKSRPSTPVGRRGR